MRTPVKRPQHLKRATLAADFRRWLATSMNLHLDHTPHAVSINDEGHVCISTLVYRAQDLRGLLDILRQDFETVELPPDLFTDDVATLEECLRLEFKSLELKTAIVEGCRVSLRPHAYLSHEERKAAPDADRSAFRTYWATRLDDPRKGTHAIYTEATLINCGIIS